MKKVFIDGSAGTTGLRIADRLESRCDIEIIKLPEERRKDPEARKEAINTADIVFLCLPDDAARESVSLAEDTDTVIIDTSTAHRVSEGWVYGFPEIGNRRELIRNAKRIGNPGCHASGFISLVSPLIEAGVLRNDAKLSCYSLTGYSGGGKKMIAQYEAADADVLFEAPRMYGLTQKHKHLPEMTAISGLKSDPVFCPIVAPYYAGMEVSIPIFAGDTDTDLKGIKAIYADYYRNGLVHYAEAPDEAGFLSAGSMTGRDDMEISVYGNDERIVLVSRFDNLGKGASGAAIQNMNLALGLDEATGLIVK